MINKYLSFLALFFITSSNLYSAENFIEKTQWKGVVDTQNIVINNSYGDVRMRYGGDKDEVEYIAVIQQLNKDDAIYVTHKIQDSVFTVASYLKSGKLNIKKSRVDITVFVPSGKNINVLTDKGLIEAKGLVANLNIKTNTGLIKLAKINGSINTTNDYGNTEIIFNKKTSTNKQMIQSIRGNISILIGENANASVMASTSGDIISDFSMKVVQNRNQEPDKTAHIIINTTESEISLYSKRGTIAVREFRIYN